MYTHSKYQIDERLFIKRSKKPFKEPRKINKILENLYLQRSLDSKRAGIILREIECKNVELI